MKKCIFIVLLFAVILTFIACEEPGEENKDEKEEDKTVTLTEDNILDYVYFEGEFVDYKRLMAMGLCIGSNAAFDFKAHAIVGGTFENVQITLRFKTPSGVWRLEENGAELFTFKMPASGEYSSKYKITSNGGTSLSGKCEFSVISVSGTFKPAK